MPGYSERDTLMKQIKDLERRLRTLETIAQTQGISVSDTPPSNPKINDLWVDTS